MATKRRNITKMKRALRHAAKTNSGRLHIVFSNGHWVLKKEGLVRSTAVFPTKEIAIEQAMKYLNLKGNVIVHHQDGSIEKQLELG